MKSPTTRDAEHAVAPTTKTSALHRRVHTPSTVLLGLDRRGCRHGIGEHRAGPVVSAAPLAVERARRVTDRNAGDSACEVAKRRDPILSGCLRGVQRLISGAQQRGRRRSVEGIRRHAGRDPEREPRVREPFREPRPDLTAERLGRIRACSREHHDELVTTETSSFGALGQRTQQDVGDLAQERVTELVPGAVVDLLEVVAVDDEDAQRYALLLRLGQCALHVAPRGRDG